MTDTDDRTNRSVKNVARVWRAGEFFDSGIQVVEQLVIYVSALETIRQPGRLRALEPGDLVCHYGEFDTYAEGQWYRILGVAMAPPNQDVLAYTAERVAAPAGPPPRPARDTISVGNPAWDQDHMVAVFRDHDGNPTWGLQHLHAGAPGTHASCKLLYALLVGAKGNWAKSLDGEPRDHRVVMLAGGGVLIERDLVIHGNGRWTRSVVRESTEPEGWGSGTKA